MPAKRLASPSRTRSLPASLRPQGSGPRGIWSAQSSAKKLITESRSCALKASSRRSSVSTVTCSLSVDTDSPPSLLAPETPDELTSASVSASAAPGGRPERSLQLGGRGTRPPVADRLAGKADDRHQLAHRGGRERLLRRRELPDSEPSLADLVPERGRFLEQHLAGDAGKDAELERGGVERPAGAPPDVRDRALEHDVSVREQDRAVEAAAARLSLGRHVHGVARRLHTAEEPGRLPPDPGLEAEGQGDELEASCPDLLELGGDLRDRGGGDGRSGAVCAGCPVEPEHRVREPRRRERLADQLVPLRPRHLRQHEPSRRSLESGQMVVEA